MIYRPVIEDQLSFIQADYNSSFEHFDRVIIQSMKTAQLGVLASLGIGVFVANGQGSGWDIKRQPWGPSTQKWVST